MLNETNRALSVSELNEYARRLLAGDPLLRNCEVTGEISGFKRHWSGHLYFSLKDANARVQCVMFRQNAMSLDFMPEDGMQVTVDASASIFVRDGSYQLYVEKMRRSGQGELYIRFERLKAKLSAEGLFDPARKKSIPAFPRTIGIATSETGAAVRDMIRVARRRNPNVGIILAPCAVQGTGAAEDIVRAIQRLNQNGESEVLLVGRGGGSIEDLWAFNEEIVARAIANSRIPVISCVGHEIDFTIADFVADVRAATPSAAAELAVPERQQIQNQLNEFALRLSGALERGQFARRERLENLTGRSAMLNPEKLILEPRRAIVNADAERAERAISRVLERAKHQLGISESALRTLNPAGVLERGYAIVSRGERVLTHANQIHAGDALAIRFADGTAYATVENGENAHGEEKNHV